MPGLITADNVKLPPLSGYVEDEVDGIRVYRNAATGEIKGQETTVTSETELIMEAIEEIAYKMALMGLEV